MVSYCGVQGRRCILLWRMYMEFERAQPGAGVSKLKCFTVLFKIVC